MYTRGKRQVYEQDIVLAVNELVPIVCMSKYTKGFKAHTSPGISRGQGGGGEGVGW